MAKTRKAEYTRLEDRAKAGHYELVEPFDFLILGFLPQQGEMFAGLYPLGETAATLTKKFDRPEVDSQMVTNRLRSLGIQGLTHKTSVGVNTGGRAIWQRTERGAALLESWKNNKGEVNGNGSR